MITFTSIPAKDKFTTIELDEKENLLVILVHHIELI